MPRLPLRPCPAPGCGVLVESGRCPKHKRESQRAQDAHRGSFRERGYTTAWDKTRKAFLAEYPLCDRCEQAGQYTPAALVHHVKPVTDGGDVLDWSNLRSLCVPCHAAVHAELERQR